jgi:hypothetical protein
MKRHYFARLTTGLLATFALAACSTDRSVLEPAADGDLQFNRSVAGTYELTFHTTGNFAIGAGVDSGSVGSEVAVRANVRDDVGNLATTGSVSFERCEVNGVYAPSADCLSGAGQWKRFHGVRVDRSGYPPTVFGARCTSPRVVGFRFKYSGTGKGIATGMSVARDFTWYAN